MRELEQLCRPLVRQLCAYWCYARCGEVPEREQVDRVLRGHLLRIREKVEDDGRLKREFQRIEQPLIFFIDYTIKEGNFPFSEAWREIARDCKDAFALSAPDAGEPPACFRKRGFRWFSVYTAMAALLLCLLGAWSWNFWVLYRETGDFRKTLYQAAAAASKVFTAESKAGKTPPENGKK